MEAVKNSVIEDLERDFHDPDALATQIAIAIGFEIDIDLKPYLLQYLSLKSLNARLHKFYQAYVYLGNPAIPEIEQEYLTFGSLLN